MSLADIINVESTLRTFDEEEAIFRARCELAFSTWRRRWHIGVDKAKLHGSNPKVIVCDWLNGAGSANIHGPYHTDTILLDEWKRWLAAD